MPPRPPQIQNITPHHVTLQENRPCVLLLVREEEEEEKKVPAISVHCSADWGKWGLPSESDDSELCGRSILRHSHMRFESEGWVGFSCALCRRYHSILQELHLDFIFPPLPAIIHSSRNKRQTLSGGQSGDTLLTAVMHWRQPSVHAESPHCHLTVTVWKVSQRLWCYMTPWH